MSELQVRIVRLEPMRVAWAQGFGETPELIAWSQILSFARAKGLAGDASLGGTQDASAHRFFGFNNPNPSPGSPNYGYEQWMTVGPNVEAEGEVEIKEVPGGLYAVTRCEGLDTIGEDWKRLVTWFADSPHKHPTGFCECLEELLTPPDVAYEEYVFDLYLPIAE